jgi:protocatechuate 3,4-dioxygenase beta subunit
MRKPSTERADAAAGSTCVLTPSQAQGPFFFDTQLNRSDIREGRPGTELRLSLRLLDAATCTPLVGTVVEIWHADASGVYSAFDLAQGNSANAAGETFLRGFQTTGPSGRVEFVTIYPGWYPGRTPHIHLMAVLGGDRVLTTQLYFPEPLSDAVYLQAPYSVKGPPDTNNTTDALTPDASAIVPLLVEASLDAGAYAGQLDVSINMT